MAEITVSQLAKLIKIDEQVLLQKLRESGVHKNLVTDFVSNTEKDTLLAFIQGASTTNTNRVLLQRKVTKQLKVSGNRKISVEVRKKQPFIPLNLKNGEDPENLGAIGVSGNAIMNSGKPEKKDEPVVVSQEQVDAVRSFARYHTPSGTELTPLEKSDVKTSSKDDMTKDSQNYKTVQKDQHENKKFPEKVEDNQKSNGFRITSKPDLNFNMAAASPTKKQNTASIGSNSVAGKGLRPKYKQLSPVPAPVPEDQEVRKNTKRIKSKKSQSSKPLLQFDDNHSRLSRNIRLNSKKLDTSKMRTQQFNKPSEREIKHVVLFEGITTNELAQKIAVKASEVIKVLMKIGVMVTINQPIDMDNAVLVIEELGHKYTIHKEDLVEDAVSMKSSDQDSVLRPPVVTIMGHVDHGKTSLLDYIRNSHVAAAESGGITQHIGAYSVITDHGKITFIDTPGHEAYTSMRARGASSTDIIILVVAADDGVMPQTVEAIQHAKASGVPIIIAVNKIDKPEADLNRIKTELSQHDIVSEDWGGDIIFASVSAKSGEGISSLLEAIILQSEILELTAPQHGAARGTVLESKLEKGRGAVATILIQSGQLNQGDIVLCGTESGRIRGMNDDMGQKILKAGPSTPVEILGLSGIPSAGDKMITVKDEKTAREVAEVRSHRQREERLKNQKASKLSVLFNKVGSGPEEEKSLNIILKADVQGSLEAISESLLKLSNSAIKVNIIAGGIGGITSSDVSLALVTRSVLFGFNVRADATAKKKASDDEIEIRYYSIIYDLISDIDKAMTGMLPLEMREEIVGIAEVRDVFRSSKFGSIAGCMVIHGMVKRNNPIRILRNQVVIYEGSLESLKRFKEDINEVKKGMECGIGIKNYNDIKPSDQIEVFETTEVKRDI
jgi:translation initiation factor IF-2